MTEFFNPFAGHEIGWDWEQHKAAGFEGGSDYVIAAGELVTSPVDGVVSKLSATAVHIAAADGRAAEVLELASVAHDTPTTVAAGDVIGVTGRVVAGVTKWPHIHGIVNGERVVFESMLAPTPAPPVATLESTMRLATTSDQGVTAGGYFVVGNGAPYRFTGSQTIANAIAVGNPTIVIAPAEWDAFLAAVTPLAVPGSPSTNFTGTFTAEASA